MYSEVLEFMLMISLKLFGEGTGNPLQYSCLENPMDGGAWWATVHGVAKSHTQQLNNNNSCWDNTVEKPELEL